MIGKVYLVGAGPGDPGLITVKGLRCLENAQVIVYDRLLDPSLLDSAPASAEQIFVGKETGRQILNQGQINQLLLDQARAGNSVVRLKGGDPFVFGRGGEEALHLAEHNIPFEVIPGVTSPVGVAAYAGIPLTHRGIATSFTVVTGSEDPSKPNSAVNWRALASTGGTLVVLMGWSTMEHILDALMNEGLDPSTPVALVQWGTWPKQLTVTGRIDNIVDLGREAQLSAPLIAIIGNVVNLHEQLSWFEHRPLFGKRVLVTRSRTQASKLSGQLRDLGAQPVELPTIDIAPLENTSELDSALDRLAAFKWVIFTSANAVETVLRQLNAQRRDSRAFAGISVGAIGPATAVALKDHGLVADFIPATSVSEAVVQELSQRYNWNDVSVLLPGADIGRDALAQGLAGLGATVEQVSAYRTVEAQDAGSAAVAAIEEGIDIVTFTSSSTVKNLMSALSNDGRVLTASTIACIGPVTASTAQELGLRVDLIAKEHNVEGLVDVLVDYYSQEVTLTNG
jgi:uroporphyrinogen III methyltransferase/synthase